MLIYPFMCFIIVDIVAFFQVLDFLCLLGGVFWSGVPGLVHLYSFVKANGDPEAWDGGCAVPPPGFLQRGRARACTALAAATRRTGPTNPGRGGRRSCTPQLARTRLPPSGVAASLHPAGGRAGSDAEGWAGPASLASGTPTGPVRPEQSAGGGEERERRCTEGELGTQGWRVSMKCSPPPPCRVDRRVVESVFLR